MNKIKAVSFVDFKAIFNQDVMYDFYIEQKFLN
jgi:hypothetical protein